MEGREKTFRNIKLIVRPSPPVLKIVLIVLIVLSMAALVTLGWVRSSIQADTEKMRQEAVALIDGNAELNDKLSQTGSAQSVQDIAEAELDLVDPNTIIIDPNGQ